MIKNISHRIEDFFIPSLCIICDETISTSSANVNNKWLCDKCINALITNHDSRTPCARCGINKNKKECACEFAWDFPFERNISFYDYDDTISQIAHYIKYKGKSQLAYHVGFISAQFLPNDFFADVDFIIPVPLHKKRLRTRGYNQSEFFARGIVAGAQTDNEKLRTDILQRVKNTETQTLLARDERQKNLDAAFAINPKTAHELSEKNIVLVDDIFTTGATTEECAETLVANGCKGVCVITLGRR